ncbi:MAG: 2-amino-4-hydroxy-6-hydroxymethyldihydropteridine diphosphokinase [Pseudomonadota bacterium]
MSLTSPSRAFTETWPPDAVPERPVRVYLGLGTNLGSRSDNLEQAIAAVSETDGITFQTRSQAIVTEPWGKTDQPAFLNAVIGVDTVLSPSALLARCLEVEAGMGRIRAEKWGPRLIDIDVLTYGFYRVNGDGLTVPHPHMTERDFVMEPLLEIAPHLTPLITRTQGV